MKNNNFKAIILVMIIASGVVMTSGCYNPFNEGELTDSEEEELRDNEVNKNTSNQTQQNNQGTNQNTQTTTKSTQTTSTKKSTSTPTTTKTTTQSPSTPTETHIHTWVQQYAGYDSSKERIKYKIYCSKCGEVSGYVWY
jgi:cytoskeletal protein RodZ